MDIDFNQRFEAHFEYGAFVLCTQAIVREGLGVCQASLLQGIKRLDRVGWTSQTYDAELMVDSLCGKQEVP